MLKNYKKRVQLTCTRNMQLSSTQVCKEFTRTCIKIWFK